MTHFQGPCPCEVHFQRELHSASGDGASASGGEEVADSQSQAAAAAHSGPAASMGMAAGTMAPPLTLAWV